MFVNESQEFPLIIFQLKINLREVKVVEDVDLKFIAR